MNKKKGSVSIEYVLLIVFILAVLIVGLVKLGSSMSKTINNTDTVMTTRISCAKGGGQWDNVNQRCVDKLGNELTVDIKKGTVLSKEYKIVYMDADGDDLQYSLGESNPVSYNVYTNDITLKTPIKKGYTFIGWTGSNGNTPELTVTIPKGSTGDRKYTANWKLSLLPYYRFYTIKYEEGSENKPANGSYITTTKWRIIRYGGTVCSWRDIYGPDTGIFCWEEGAGVTTYKYSSRSVSYEDSNTCSGVCSASEVTFYYPITEWSEWTRCDGADLSSCPTNSGNITYESKMCNPDTGC